MNEERRRGPRHASCGGLRDTCERRAAGPAQSIMVESEHPLDDLRGAAGWAVDTPPAVAGDPAAIGPYRVLGRLGAGGMGTVYLAQSPAGARVAIKIIRPELAGDAAFLDRFRREVAAARRVAGFCTARVLDANLDGSAPYLVTEYVDGVRLDLVVERDGPLAASNLEGLAVGVAAACAAIHAAEVVHRDLKPGNVLLSYFGPRVIDFGIARALDDGSASLTRAGTVMGTPAWMAPEQFGSAPVTTAADIFAWGGLVAYAGTGRLAFGRGPVAVLPHGRRRSRRRAPRGALSRLHSAARMGGIPGARRAARRGTAGRRAEVSGARRAAPRGTARRGGRAGRLGHAAAGRAACTWEGAAPRRARGLGHRRGGRAGRAERRWPRELRGRVRQRPGRLGPPERGAGHAE